jgi:hypothetical protein
LSTRHLPASALHCGQVGQIQQSLLRGGGTIGSDVLSGHNAVVGLLLTQAWRPPAAGRHSMRTVPWYIGVTSPSLGTDRAECADAVNRRPHTGHVRRSGAPA